MIAGVRITLEPLDEQGEALSRRGVTVAIPEHREDFNRFAQESGKLVTRTIERILGGGKKQ